jgi:hypothetical protein
MPFTRFNTQFLLCCPDSFIFLCRTVKFTIQIKDNILVTPNYNFTVYKNPVIRKEANGKTVLVLNTTGQYVELPNKGIECIQDMTKCDSGFTLRVKKIASRYFIFLQMRRAIRRQKTMFSCLIIKS